MRITNHSDVQHDDWIARAKRQYETVKAKTPGSSVDGFVGRRDVDALFQAQLPGYQILREVHRGGQGVVYEAVQTSTRRTVALKVMREGPFAGDMDRLRFDREVSILAQLNHRSIIGILERGESAGSHFLVMDYVDGSPLDRFARENGLGLSERLQLFAKVCDAVSSAHMRGVIHRDLKPGNILVDAAGEPRILDFGLAKMAASTTTAEATQTGQFVGSLPWVSPEQARGLHAEVDVRSDVYSLGVMLYQLLADRLPYSTVGDLERALSVIRTVEPERPSSHCPEIDDDIETIAMKCLAKEPARRYQSVGELARDVRHYLQQEPIEAKRDSAVYVLRKTLHRHRGTVAASAAFVLLLATATILSLFLWRRAAAQRDEAMAATKREAVARQRATAERSKATQLAQFAQGMLSGIDPATAGGMDKRLMRSVLDGSSKRVESELRAEPEVQAAVLHTIGKAYFAIGEYPASQQQLEKAVKLGRATLGDDHPETLAAMDDLSMVYYEQARYKEAESLCSTALEGRRRVLGTQHRDTLLSMSNMAEIYAIQGKYAEAESLCTTTLDLRTRLLGPEDADTLTSMNNMADLNFELGRIAEAERMFRQVIEVERRVKGTSHPQTLRTMNNLGLLLNESSRLNEAETLTREVLAQRRLVLGDDHEDTLSAIGNLAEVLRHANKLEEAESLLSGLVQTERRVRGPKHPTLALHLNNLGRVMAKREDFAGAEPFFRESLAINEASLPKGNWQIATAKLGLGYDLTGLGKFTEAESVLINAQRALQGKPEVSPDWQNSAITHLVKLYEAWDKAAPNTGMDAKAREWRAKLPPASQPSEHH